MSSDMAQKPPIARAGLLKEVIATTSGPFLD
jgi:hypothetical protein